MKNKKFQYVHCYYCGRLTRLDKAVVLTVGPRLKPDVPDTDAPKIIMSNPIKVYICPACARYRGISKKSVGKIEKENDILKKLGIEV